MEKSKWRKRLSAQICNKQENEKGQNNNNYKKQTCNKKLAKKKYYIQVCAYKVNSNGKKVKGKWSAKKAIKVKKQQVRETVKLENYLSQIISKAREIVELDNYLSLPKRGAVSMKQYRYSALIVGEDGIFLL